MKEYTREEIIRIMESSADWTECRAMEREVPRARLVAVLESATEAEVSAKSRNFWALRLGMIRKRG